MSEFLKKATNLIESAVSQHIDIDINNDGQITIQEGVQKFKEAKFFLKSMLPDEFIAGLDYNHDGKISWSEVVRAYKAFRDEIDANADGKLSFNEWVKALSSKNNFYTRVFKWIATSILTFIATLVIGFYTNDEYSIWSIIASMFMLIVSFGQYTMLDSMKNANAAELEQRQTIINSLTNENVELRNRVNISEYIVNNKKD